MASARLLIWEGTPTTAGTFTITVRVTDDLDAFSEKELSITIS